MSIAAPGFPGPASIVALAASGVRARRAAAPGFCLPGGAEAASVDAAARSAPIGLPGLLAMQEASADAAQDRAARRHAGSMLAEMSALQRALLQGDGAALSAALARMADLARQSPAALDPRLAAVVRAIAQRAAVEAARNAAQQRAAESGL